MTDDMARDRRHAPPSNVELPASNSNTLADQASGEQRLSIVGSFADSAVRIGTRQVAKRMRRIGWRPIVVGSR